MIWIHHPVSQTLLNQPQTSNCLRDRRLAHTRESTFRKLLFIIPLILLLLYHLNSQSCHQPLYSLMIKKSVSVAQMSCTPLCTSFYHLGLSLQHDTWLTSPQFGGKSLDAEESLKHP